jgi:hypothetical protein
MCTSPRITVLDVASILMPRVIPPSSALKEGLDRRRLHSGIHVTTDLQESPLSNIIPILNLLMPRELRCVVGPTTTTVRHSSTIANLKGKHRPFGRAATNRIILSVRNEKKMLRK